MANQYEYDVALSFAGENREYVDQVYLHLMTSGVKPFYDQAEEVDLWGKNLTEHLDDIYRNKARYCVMFISQHYADKVWPNLEKRSALARELIDTGYILPARFDDADILGLPPSKAYVDLQKKTPEQLVELIIKKLGRVSAPTINIRNQSYRRPKTSKSFNPYKEAQEWIDFLTGEFRSRSENSDISFTSFDREGRRCLRFVVNGNTIYSLDIQIGSLGQDKGLSFYGVEGEVNSLSKSYNAWGDFEWNKEKEEVILKLHDMSFIKMSSANPEPYNKIEFVDAVWNKICDAIDSKS